MTEALLWYLVSVLLAVRGVTQLGSEPWPLTAATLAGAAVAVGMAAWRTPLDRDAVPSGAPRVLSEPGEQAATDARVNRGAAPDEPQVGRR